MLGVTDKLILTAGPTISYKEVENVTDAVLHGWNHHHSDYIRRFEEAFADYIGVKYALATSSCTGALHLALLAMGVGPGDEVIVPEMTWIATVSAVKYVGATPVFVDIEPDTWVMDPASAEKAITPKTKVIIPVHLYGHPVNMQPILDMASKYGIDVLEDAAPSIGAEFEGKKTGSMGKAAAFSFQGAKALVSGEGGILVSNDKEFIERARFLGDHGRDPHSALQILEIGYKYKMSNMQGALALAQVERAEEIVARKREIFRWYQERLEDIPGIYLNTERPWARSIFWLTSLVLGDSINISRQDFMKKLKERNIDSRPFFSPISSFPMFRGIQVNNPVAYNIPFRGVNLPSGHERTEEEIDYICAHIRDILGAAPSNKINTIQPTGWLAFRDKTNKILRDYKHAYQDTSSLPIEIDGKVVSKLRPITFESLEDEKVIQALANWRSSAQKWFPSQFNVTPEGTRKWLENQVLHTDDRILFMIETQEGNSVGHVGLFRFDYKNKSCEIDNIVRGVSDVFPGAMYLACNVLLNWVFNIIGIETAYLKTVSDNEAALKLYKKLGFKEMQRFPLMKIEEAGTVRWIEAIGQPYREIEKYSVTMKLTKSGWMK